MASARSVEAAVLGVGTVLPGEGPTHHPVPEGLGAPCPAYACVASPGSGVLAAKVLRRLGRAQRLAMTAAHFALEDAGIGSGDRGGIAICLGTGMGELGHTYAFLENMIALDEVKPKPASFINSVHNAIAGQMAIALSCKGENHTFIHGSISFESALWQALHLLDRRRAERVLVCGVDELNGYMMAADRAFERFQEGDDALTPMSATAPGGPGTLPGEGAVAIVLGRVEDAPNGSPRIRGVCARPIAPAKKSNLGAQAEVRFIQEALGRSDLRPADVDLVICSANGDSKEDASYREVLEGLGAIAGLPLAHGVFKHGTGDFHTAAAVGVALGIESVTGPNLSDRIRCVGPAPGTDLRHAIVYSLYSSGFHSVCVVTS